ncbi:hypothetical protein EZZ79_24915 [Pseudomonas syringae]|nr:hypothetical protein EZZ79_24915 [Pseudomonas syringae]
MILTVGRRSELVRERASIFGENASPELLSSRASSLLRPAGRSLKNAVFGPLGANQAGMHTPVPPSPQ